MALQRHQVERSTTIVSDSTELSSSSSIKCICDDKNDEEAEEIGAIKESSSQWMRLMEVPHYKTENVHL